MPVKIRLARGGRKKLSHYRIVAADSRTARDGRFLETLGTYNPQAEPKEFSIKTDRVAYWLEKGAVATETVKNLMKQDGFALKVEAVKKGISAEDAGVARKPERKRKPKATAKKSS